jgi:hypothetical protein
MSKNPFYNLLIYTKLFDTTALGGEMYFQHTYLGSMSPITYVQFDTYSSNTHNVTIRT